MVAVLVAGFLVATPQPAQAAPTNLSVVQPKAVTAKPVAAKPRPADMTQGAGKAASAKTVWPAAGVAEASLIGQSAPGTARANGGDPLPVVARAGSLPVWVGPATASAGTNRAATTATAAVSRARVEVLDRAKVPAGWQDGVLVRVGRADAVTGAGRVQLGVDYSGFAGAFGADWSTRLRLVALPECALTTPSAAGCRGTELPSRNDVSAKRVSADVELPAAPSTAAANASGTQSTGQLLALRAAASGDAGNYGATPLQSSSTWAVGGSGGEFSWSYPMRVPPVLGGPAPSLSLAYSSSAVDGRSDASNNQPSWIGEGFEYTPGYVERRYTPCSEDMAGEATNDTATGDLCWGTDNAVMSLNGRSAELVRDTATGQWRLKGDDASKVEHLTGMTANGDNDGEYWKITAANGMQYFFGQHALPGQTSTTNSTNWVRVYGNHPGEPCYNATFESAYCNQAWRWNLDYAIDTHGNTMSLWYSRDGNKYAANNTDSNAVIYHRGSTLNQIQYGTWDRGAADRSVTPTATVVFTAADRCLSDCTIHDEAHWPDVPWDQECAGTECPGKYSPTFWTTKRLAKITTRVKGVTPDVESWTLNHTFPDNGDSSRNGMWLESVAHSGGTTTTPEINFDFVHRPNRVDTIGDTKPPLYWMRMGTIWTETGGKVSVVYSDPQCVANSVMPASPETNTLRCYPVLSENAATGKTETEYFHKYVVNQVIESDWTGGGTDVTSSYEYLDGVAWRHTDDNGLTPDKFRTWSDYGGYGRVRMRQGDPVGGQQTLTESRYYRGLHGDKASPSGGTRNIQMPAIDLNGDGDTTDPEDAPQVNDEDTFAGQVRQQIVYNGVDTDPISTTVNQAWQSAPTATRDMGDTTEYARYSGVDATWNAVKLDGGRGWRVTRQNNTFDSYGMPDTTTDFGDLAVAGDEMCADNTYARNTGINLLSLPSRVQTFTLPCGQAPTSSDHIFSDIRTSYDKQAAGVAPTKGDATTVETLKDWTSAAGTTFMTASRTTFDVFGRAVEAYDARNNKTSTAYTPASGGPVTKVATTNHLGWVSSQTLEPTFGLPIETSDVNSKVTTLKYDGLGRLTKVWLPNRLIAANPDSPSMQYDYLIRNTGGVNAVTTRTINAEGNYVTSYALSDGLLRGRQTQTAAVSGGGTVFTQTDYDSAGRVAYSAGNHHDPALTAGTKLVAIAPWQFNSQNVNVYDRASRITDSILMTSGQEKWRTRTVYGGDRTYVTPPRGGTPTTSITDAQGNLVELRRHSGGSTSGPFDETKYSYTRKAQLSKVVDAAGNEWTYGFDLLGRQISADDPDKGLTTSSYNDFGDLTSTKDDNDKTLVYTYDSLGRKTGLYENAVTTANKRATWAYDPSGAKGQLASSSRWTDSGVNEYKVAIAGYTALYQSTGEEYTIPASETGLSGSYFFGRSYKADGSSLATQSFPNTAGLGGEQLTFTYDGVTGLPEQVQTNWPGAGQYVTNTDWTAFGELAFVQYQQTAQNFLQRSFVYEDSTRRLHSAKANRQIAPQLLADVNYEYDEAGNITKIADTPAGGTADTQCFGYDYQRRLTEAWTPSGGNCGTAPTVAGLGGPAPYWHSWTFDEVGKSIGNRVTETKHAATNTVSTYKYPAAGADRPHAATQVVTTGTGAGTKNYTFDDTGNTTCRPNPTAVNNTCPPGTGSQKLTWDVEGRLDTLVDGATTNKYVYGADGNRLIARDGTGKTLYLPGMEVHYTTSGGSTTATRYYSHAGQVIGSRAPGTDITWVIGDQQGTQQLAVKSGDQAITQRRQTPYGGPRGTNPVWPTPKGFVGGDNDPTGLVHLGAREYDPGTGRFISLDPIIDYTDPQQMQGYSYASNTPVTMSDPDGLMPLITETPQGDAQHYRETGERVVMGSKGKFTVRKEPVRKPSLISSDQGGPTDADVERAKKIKSESVISIIVKAGGQILLDLIGVNDILGCIGGNAMDCVFAVAGMLPWGKAFKLIKDSKRIAGTLARAARAVQNFFEEVKWATNTLKRAEDAAEAAAKQVDDAFGSCPLHSFAAGTKVVTADGDEVPIEELDEGDRVLATDPETGKTEARTVTKTHINNDTALTDLTIVFADGSSEVVKTTQHHPIWSETRKAWIGAADLETGEHLLTLDRKPAIVDEVASYAGAEVMYDLTVDVTHTYYVVAGDTPVLVHNCGTGPSGLIDLDAASASGATLQRGGYSVAGRALQKHADRAGTGSNWPRPAGRENPQGWNSAGQDMLDDILTNPDSVAHLGYGRVGGQWQDTLDVRLPGGRGARFDLNGNFSGFLD
ncbi:polymorphic toxin-type HINT domain-containing protein [Micromonospora pisi]|nr:polymorphic toxin-type HINT domain-containing protein [Micromonospora pisi]